MNSEWRENRTVLYIQKSRVFMLYKMRERSAGDNIIPEESLKYYLEQSRAYLGEKSTRFYVTVKGQKVVEPNSVPDSQGRYRYQQSVQRCYCFDYDMLKRIYGLHLPTASDKMEDVDD